jgi:GH25 family lysozyme M1 (1,4-beta-N-acetylmuramidase)
MASLQNTFKYGGDASTSAVNNVNLHFEIPTFEFTALLQDGRLFQKRSDLSKQFITLNKKLIAISYTTAVPNEFLVGHSNDSLKNFYAYLSHTGFTNNDPGLLDSLSAEIGVGITDEKENWLGQIQMPSLYTLSTASDKYKEIMDQQTALNSGAAVNEEAVEKLELELADYIRKNIFILNKNLFAEAAIQFKLAEPTFNEYALLFIIAHVTDVSSGNPKIKIIPDEFKVFLKTNFEIGSTESIKTLLDIITDDLFDFPITVPEITTAEIKGMFRIKTPGDSAVAIDDFKFFDLSVEYTIQVPGGNTHPVAISFDWAGVQQTTNNTVPFSFAPVITNLINSSINVRVKAYAGSVIWENQYAVTNPDLQNLIIEVPLLKPAVIITNDEPKSSGGNKKLAGKVVEMSGACKLNDLTVVIQAKRTGDAIWKIVGAATTDSSGNFSLPYPYGNYIAAQALVSLMPDGPADINVYSDAAHVAINETIADDFLYLLLKDVNCEVNEKKEGEDCDCKDIKKANRLPSQEELIKSDSYSQDIGGSCVNLSTPNRTLNEYPQVAIVRTSDPDVSNYILSKDSKGNFILEGGLTKIVRKPVDLGNPIYWQDAPDDHANSSLYQAVTVATGHILHYSIITKADGYSLGELLYSLPLAPGQKKEIVIFEQTHTLTGSESQRLSQSESLAASLVNDVGITDTIAGNLAESTKGSSSASTAGVSGGSGIAGIIYGIAGTSGVAGGVANSNSTASQNSSRSLSEYFHEQIKNAINQNAQSYREMNASVITTVQEGQNYGVTTEVVANHNHCHSLTMMYFEVLRHYAIYQELSYVEECLFIPLLMTDFTRENIFKWRDVLASHLLPMPSETYLQPFTLIRSGRQHPLLRAFDAIERIKTNYENVDFPDGAYDDEVINFITGEMYIRTNLPRPKTTYDRIKSWPIVKRTAEDTHHFWAGVGAVLQGPLGAFVGDIFDSNGNVTHDVKVIIDKYIEIDGNYETVPPAQCIRIKKIDQYFFEDGGFDKQQWTAYANLLGEDPLVMLNYYFKDRLVSEWDSIFYNDIAPLVFEKICKNISLQHAPQNFSGIDFSVETKYKGGDVNTKINLRGNGSNIKRNQIEKLTIGFDNSASLTGDLVTLFVRNVSIRYSTPHYNGVLCNVYVGDDLIDNTDIDTPENANEKRNPKKEDAYMAQKLIEHLNSNLEHYNKALWRDLDSDRRYMLLDGFNIETYNDFGQPVGYRSLASVVKNELIGISGNALIMPVAPGYKIDRTFVVEQPIEGPAVELNLFEHYKPLTPIPPYRISIPSKGVFAEAVQGACDACEKVKENTSQDWEKFKTDEPTAINPVTVPVPTVTDWKAAFKDFATPIVNIQNAPAAPAPGAGLASVTELLGKSDVFKDITGLDQNQKNALQTYLSNQQNAKDFAQMAKDIFTMDNNTKHSDAIADAIRNSPELSKEEKAQLLKDHYGQRIDGGQTKKADQENAQNNKPSLTDAAVKAADEGKAVKATSNDADGKAESVDIGPGDKDQKPLAEVKTYIQKLLQEKKNACWATAATIMMSWKKGVAQNVKDVLALAGAEYVQLFTDEKELPSSLKEDFISKLGMVGEPPASYLLQKYIDWVNTYGPLWITTDSSAQDGVFSPHARILTKIIGTGTPDGIGTSFIFIDPATGREEAPQAYNDFLKVYEQMVTDNPGNLFIQIVHFTEPGEGAGGGGGSTPPAGWPLGVDIFEGNNTYQRNVFTTATFAALKAAGNEFVITRTSQGRTDDTRFTSYYQWIKDNGMIRGTYHFFSNKHSNAQRWGGTIAQQADKVIERVMRLTPGDLSPALDLEDEPRFTNGCADPPKPKCKAPAGKKAGDGRFPLDVGILPNETGYRYRHINANNPNRGAAGLADLLNDIREFMNRIEKALGRIPMIYTSNMWKDSDMMNNPMDQDFSIYPLWTVAHGNRNWDTISVGAWGNEFSIMQFGEDADGIDLDAYSGTVYGLRGLADIGRPGLALNASIVFIPHLNTDQTLHLISGNLPITLISSNSFSETDILTPPNIDITAPFLGGDPTAIISSGILFTYIRTQSSIVELIQNDLAHSGPISQAVAPIHDPKAIAVGNKRYVIYWGNDDDWHLLYWDGTTWAAPEALLSTTGILSRNASGVAISGMATGQPVIYENQGIIHVVGRVGRDGHLFEVYQDGSGGWLFDDITKKALISEPGLPAATYSPCIYQDSNGVFITYRGVGGQLWKITRSTYESVNLTSATNSVLSTGHPSCFVLNDIFHIIYRGKDKLIYEIWLNGLTWKVRSLSNEKAAADPVASSNTTIGLVVFQRADGKIHVAKFDGTSWTDGAIM